MNWYNHLGICLLVLIGCVLFRVFSKDEVLQETSLITVTSATFLGSLVIFTGLEVIGWVIYLIFL